MDFVSDFRTKQKIAERLRAREKSLMGAAQSQDYSPIVTQGQGAAPTQVQANWGAPISALGQAFFANRTGEKADEAEAEAQASRMQALQNIMGAGQQVQAAAGAPAPSGPMTGVNTGSSPVQTMQGVMGPGAGAQGAGNAPAQSGALGGAPQKLSVEQIMQLSQLGLPDQVLKKLVPDEPALGAVAQAAQTHAGIDALVATGVWSPEKGKEMHAGLKAQEEAEIQQKKDLFKWQQDNTYRAPREGRAPSEFELYQQNPEAYAKYQEAKGAGSKAGGKAAAKAEEAAQATQNMRGLLGEMKATATDPSISAARNQAGALLTQYDSPVAKAVGSKLMNSAGIKMQSLQLDAALAEASKLTPVSNTDFKALMSRYNAAITNPKEFTKFVDEYERFLSKHGQQPQQANEYAPNNVDNQGLYNKGSRINKSSSGITFEVED